MVIALFIILLFVAVPSVGTLDTNPADVEGRYGRETVEALKRLYAPPTDRYGLVKPKNLHSDWSDTPQATTYRQWIMNVVGKENYEVLNKKLLENAAIEAANPELAPVRKMLRNAFRGNPYLPSEIKEKMEERK